LLLVSGKAASDDDEEVCCDVVADDGMGWTFVSWSLLSVLDIESWLLDTSSIF